jgi:hypothetical protein
MEANPLGIMDVQDIGQRLEFMPPFCKDDVELQCFVLLDYDMSWEEMFRTENYKGKCRDGNAPDPYEIPWNECNTTEKLLQWVYHITGKQWVDSAHITELMEICSARFDKIKLHNTKREKKTNSINKRNPLSPKLRFTILQRDQFRCVYCGNKAPDVVLHIDHIHPKSKGGEDVIENLVTSCLDCNIGKRTRLLATNPLEAHQ